jgi:hypothetical protein
MSVNMKKDAFATGKKNKKYIRCCIDTPNLTSEQERLEAEKKYSLAA